MAPILALPAALLLLLLASSSGTSAFFLGPRPAPPSSLVAMRAAGPDQPQRQPNLSRSELLQRQSVSILAGAALILLGPQRGGAAVPTIQEYYGGVGASTRTNNYIITGKARKGGQPEEMQGALWWERSWWSEGVYVVSRNFGIASIHSRRGAAAAAAASRPPGFARRGGPGAREAEAANQGRRVRTMRPPSSSTCLHTRPHYNSAHKTCRWDDVLAASKKRPLNVLLTPYLGYGSAAALAQAAGKTAAQVRRPG